MFKYFLTFLFSLLIGLGSGKAAQFDRIKKVLLYETDSSTYLILHEIHLRITDGSYERGTKKTSGFTESVIRVLNINTGEFVAEKHMGLMDSTAACQVLACSNNQLWIYWNKHKSGLQALNPITLEKTITQAQIYSKMKGATGSLIIPKWNKINHYYNYNAFTDKLMISNTDGNRFYFNATTFEISEYKDDINYENDEKDFITSETKYKDSTLSISARFNGAFEINNNTIPSDKKYREGYFILEQNPSKLYKHYNKLLNDEPIDSTEILKNIDALVKGRKADDVFLNASNDNSGFYVIHRNTNKPDAIAQLSKVEIIDWKHVITHWSTPLHFMFWDISEARNTRAFKKLYPVIVPNPNYRFFEISNKQMVVIYLKQITCINTIDGSVIWRQRL